MNAPLNIASRLSEMARRYPHKPAVVVPAGRHTSGRRLYAHLTFAQLDDEASRYAAGFERAGIGRATRTVVMVRPGLEFFTIAFALFRAGAVPVLIDPGLGLERIVECLARVEPEAFIGIPLAQAVRVIHRREFKSVRVKVCVGKGFPGSGIPWLSLRGEPGQAVETEAGDPAAILFTSGSTGPPKGVVYEHGMFDAQVRALESHYGYGPDEVDLPTFPLFALFDTALGMTAVVPDMDFTRPGSVDPRNILEAATDWGATHMFGSPALLNRVGRWCRDHGERLPSLRRVITAGAPVTPAILETLAGALPDGAQIFTAYGATEALPVASMGHGEILADTREKTARGWGTCVGRPVGDVQVRIIDITDNPLIAMSEAEVLGPGEIGEICVSGPVVTKEYFRTSAATRMAKIGDGARIWHRMGDCGYFDHEGRLWYCGRKSQRVVTSGGTLFTDPVEGVFNSHPKVFRTALVGVGAPFQQKAVLCVELEEPARREAGAGLAVEIVALGRDNPVAAQVTEVLFHKAFPVDIRHNAKIFREQLAAWATGQLEKK